MTTESALESEELENIALVRMEDVQPDRSIEYSSEIRTDDESSQDDEVEACIVDGEDYECVNDDDSNIGSMVSVQTENVICEELIVPEVLGSDQWVMSASNEDIGNTASSPNQLLVTKPTRPESWPILEILPGGVINLMEKTEITECLSRQDPKDMLYACAKCSESFKHLFSLVKHVRSHKQQSRREKIPIMNKSTSLKIKLEELKKREQQFDEKLKIHQSRLRKTLQSSKKSKAKVKYIEAPAIKKTVLSKPLSKLRVYTSKKL